MGNYISSVHPNKTATRDKSFKRHCKEVCGKTATIDIQLALQVQSLSFWGFFVFSCCST